MSVENDDRVINSMSPVLRNFLNSTMEAPKPFHERFQGRKFVDYGELDTLMPEPYTATIITASTVIMTP
jgi:hypothetical protein